MRRRETEKEARLEPAAETLTPVSLIDRDDNNV